MQIEKRIICLLQRSFILKFISKAFFCVFVGKGVETQTATMTHNQSGQLRKNQST